MAASVLVNNRLNIPTEGSPFGQNLAYLSHLREGRGLWHFSWIKRMEAMEAQMEAQRSLVGEG